MSASVVWREEKAREYCSSVRDGTHDSPKFVDQGHPLITSKAIKDGALLFDSAGFISEKDFSEINKRSKVDQWDILFTMIGTLGEVYLEKSSQIDYAIKNVGLFKCDDEIKAKWLYLWFRNHATKQSILQLRRGASQQYLPLGMLRELKIKYPSDWEYGKRIIDLIYRYDDLIENNKRRIELLEDSARQLYKEWFVRFRFPGHEHVKIIDGLPDGWELKKLGDLFAKIKRAGKIKKEEYIESGEFPCVDQSQSFIGGYTDNQEAIIKEPLPLVIFGDHTRILKFVDFPFACGADGTQILYPNDDRLSIEYFYFSLLNVDLSNYFYARHFKFLKDQEILIPSERHIKAFTEFACSNMKQISKLRDQCLQLSKARDILLPKLMSGELAV